MTRIKSWPHPVEFHRRRAVQYARRIVRLGDTVLAGLATGQRANHPAHLAQIHRWAKTIHTEMIRARQPGVWPRLADEARVDVIVLCERVARLVKELEQSLMKPTPETVALTVGQIQVLAQEIELRLSQVG